MAQQGIDEKIEGYLNGDLTGAERAAFERDMALDPALAAEVEQQRRLTESLGHIRLRRQSDAAVATARQILARRRRIIAGLGALCILVALVWYFFQNRPALSPPPGGTPAEKTIAPAEEPVSPKPEDPAPASRSAPPIAQTAPANRPDNLRGDAAGEKVDSTLLPLFDRALRDNAPVLPEKSGSYFREVGAMNAGSYSGAARLLLLRPLSDTSRYLLAVAQLHLHQPRAAAQNLFPLNRAGQPFQPEARWMLGLCYVLQGKDEAARATLELIANNPRHTRQQAAKLLLESIDE